MDLISISTKVVGIVFLAFTIRSIVKHFRDRRIKTAATGVEEQSLTEVVLNNLLLYLWLVFMIVFSVGMIVNN